MARPNPRYEQLVQERNIQQNIADTRSFALTQLRPADIISNLATGLKNEVNTSNQIIRELDPQINLEIKINKIIEDIDNNKFIVPDYFNNNITWVLSGEITGEGFIDSYNYLLNQGIIHTPTPEPTPEPITVTPIPEQKNIYRLLF